MIKRLSYQNIKGHCAAYGLAPITVFTGANAAGKSANIDALDIGLLGYHPKLGRTAQAMFQLSSGPYMSVTLETSSGIIERVIESKGSRLSSKDNGPTIEYPPIMRDSSLYFGLSQAARVRLVAGLISSGAFNGLDIDAIRASIKNIRLKENTPASEKSIQNVLKSLEPIDAPSALEWLSAARDIVKGLLVNAKATRSRMSNVSAALTELQDRESGIQVQLSGAENSVAAARTALESIQKEFGASQQRVKDAERRAALRASLEAISAPSITIEQAKHDAEATKRIYQETIAEIGGLDELEKKQMSILQSRSESSREVGKIEGEIMGLNIKYRSELAKVKSAQGIQLYELLAKNTSHREELSKMSSEDDLNNEIQKLIGEGSGITVKIESLLSELKSLNRQLKTLDGASECPTCHAPCDTWKDKWLRELKEKISQTENEVTDCQKKLELAHLKQRQLITLIGRCKELKAQILANEYIIEEYNKNIAAERAAKETEELLSEKKDLLNLAKAKYEAIKKENDELQSRITNLRTLKAAVDASEKEFSRVEKDWTEYRIANSQITAIDPEELNAENESRAKIQERMNGVAAVLSNREEALRQAQSVRNDLRRQLEAAQLVKETESEIEILNHTAGLINEKEAEFVTKAFESLLKTVNIFTSTVMNHPVEYHEGKIGYFKARRFIPADTMSGSEEAMVQAGLSIALASNAPHKVAIIDECTRLIGENKARLVDRLVFAIQNKIIDQAILVDGPNSAYTDAVIKHGEIVKIIPVN